MKKEKGITLIALVITIIILLILAGVTLTIALSENGLFSQAKRAVGEYENVAEKEDTSLQEAVKTIENMIQGNNKEELPPEIKEATLNVKLKVKEAEVTGSVIPITVKQVTQKSDSSNVSQENMTYTWSYENSEEWVDGNTHIFSGLNEQQSYTLKCKVETENGEWGTGEITVISFSIKNKYYRATKGMCWRDLADSEYDTSAPDVSDIDVAKLHSHSDPPNWLSLRYIYDANYGFPCEQCGIAYDAEYRRCLSLLFFVRRRTCRNPSRTSLYPRQ